MTIWKVTYLGYDGYDVKNKETGEPFDGDGEFVEVGAAMREIEDSMRADYWAEKYKELKRKIESTKEDSE